MLERKPSNQTIPHEHLVIMEKNNLVLTETDLQQNYAQGGAAISWLWRGEGKKREKKESVNRQERNKVRERVHKS